MSIAFSRIKVRIIEVQGLAAPGLEEGSIWEKGNLLFRSPREGRMYRLEKSQWARGTDAQGRAYLLWEADHTRARGLVIQPEESCYCFEVSRTTG
jgi:hypothetical protein